LLFESRYPKSNPYIVLFKSNNKPIALIIGATYKSSVPIKVGYVSANTPVLNNLDIEIDGLIADGQKESDDVIVEFLKALLQQKKIDKLEIIHLSETHRLWDQVKSGLGVNNKAIYKLGVEWIGQIRDTKTGEIYNKNSSKTRATFRRKDKKLLKHFNDQLEVVALKTTNDVEHFIKMADSIGKKSYQYAINVGVQDNDFWRSTLKAMANNNLFRGYLLMSSSIPIAYIQGPVFKDVFHLFATSFDPEYRNLSPGGFLLRKTIELLVKEKVNSIHFGYGDTAYKRLFGTTSKSEASFRIYGFTIKARVSKVLDQSAVAMHETINGILEKTGLLDKVKKMWRSKLSKA